MLKRAITKVAGLDLSFRSVWAMFLTAMLVVIGAINIHQRARWSDPSDGVYWVETAQGLLAEEVDAGGPGDAAGIRAGEILVAINGERVTTLGGYSDALYRIGIDGSADYRLMRGMELREVGMRIAGRPFLQSRDLLRGILAAVHLFIGLFVMIRGSRQPRAFHFFLICLASFVVYLYSFTPALTGLDWLVYSLSITAFLALPALFVHFCLRFPFDLVSGRSRAWLIYLPAMVLGLVQVLWLTGHLALLGLARIAAAQALLERIHLVYFCAGFLAGGTVLIYRKRQARDFTTRQQMKWVGIGTLAGIIPFSLIYGVPWILGVRTSFALESSQLFLALIPLSFSYAIVRYRLIDVDVIARRGAAYFIASSLLLGFYIFSVLVLGKAFERMVPESGFLIASLAALAIALLFAPLKNAVQLRLDRYFYRNQFDDRAGLLEFARTLSTEIGLQRLSRQILERVRNTFGIDRAALFLADPGGSNCYRIADAIGAEALVKISPVLREDEIYEMESAGRHAASRLRRAHPLLQKEGLLLLQELNVRGRKTGIIALGSMADGRHFSTEDVLLLQALARYAAIALENASLYRSVEVKAAELEQLRKYTENIIESINIAVLALNLEGRVTSCNRAFELLYGVQRDSIRGLPVEELLAVDVVASIHNAAGSSAWARPEPTNIYRLFVENRRSERLTVDLSVIPMHDAIPENSGCLIVMDDISDKIRMQDQLLQVEKLSSIGLLAAGLAHEVNTPITGISSYTQMLLKGMPDTDQRKPILEKIEKQTFRAAEIVNGLLNFARVNGTEFTDLDVNRLIQESLTLLEHQFRRSRIRVEPSLEPSVPPIYGNAGKLQQVFINLLLNAKDAMPSGGQLVIRTRRNDSMVEVEIADTGVGISAENIKRIFDPFYTTKKTGKGTGLGLAITYGIIQEHGGRIFVDSIPQQGTHFRVKLPTREAAGA